MPLISKIKHFLHPIQGEVWCLHRVVAERSLYPSNRELEITTDYLEGLILKYKQEGFEFVGLDAIVKDSQRKIWGLKKQKRVNVSFDDGFRDVYENAFPIFKKYHIPFTIYLVGSFPEGKCDVWWIQMEQFFKDQADFEQCMKKLYQSQENMNDLMHSVTKSKADFDLCGQLALTWEQLGEMVASGLCTVGSHTMSHPGLTRMPLETVEQELVESKRMIEAHLPVTVKHFSYPHSMINEEVQRLVKTSGYESATIGYGGNIRVKDNPYQLYRHYIVQA
jgi:peptidoglycan/xylan/chitin deacetylase (PgdA/CDA1 family)